MTERFFGLRHQRRGAPAAALPRFARVSACQSPRVSLRDAQRAILEPGKVALRAYTKPLSLSRARTAVE